MARPAAPSPQLIQRLVRGSLVALITFASVAHAARPVPPHYAEPEASQPARAEATSSFDALWVGYPLPSTNVSIRALLPYGGSLVVAGSGWAFGTTAATNIARWDGLTWQAMGTGIPRQVNALVAYGGQLIAGSNGGSGASPGVGELSAVHAWNGSAWTLIGAANGSVNAMVVIGSNLYVGGTFVSVNGVAASKIARWDGSNWFPVGTGFSSTSIVRALTAQGSTLIAGGTIATYQGIAQWNGITWSMVGAGLQNSAAAGVVNSLASDGVTLYAGGTFNLSGGAPVTNVAAWNGVAWSGLAGATSVSDALALYGGFPMATVSDGGPLRAQLWNGSAWQPFNHPNVRPFAYGLDGSTLYAAGSTSVGIGGQTLVNIDPFYSFNGSAWTPLQQAWAPGMKGFTGLGYTAQQWHGSLYVGGTMGHVGTGTTHLQSPGVAQWDGSNWASIGGVGGQHFDMTVWNDSLVASVDGKVRVWNGATWRKLASTTDNANSFDTFGNGLAVYQGNLHVFGPTLLSPGSIALDGVARWTGSTWVPVGSGFPDNSNLPVTGTQWGSNLAIGGLFTSAGGGPARNLAYWDGAAYHELGGGVNNWVYTLLADGSDLIAGGEFTEAGGTPVNAVARWNGTGWSAMGTRARTVNRVRSHAGRIYAAGTFLDDNNQVVAGAARWTGTEWRLLGSGLDRVTGANTLEFLGDDLYLVGSFNRANGQVARSFARLPNASTVDAPAPSTRTSRLALAPSRNPSRGSVSLTISLPSSGPARLTIHDVSGREVARLLDGAHEAGTFSLAWDARVAPGLYLAMLESAGERRSARLVRVR